MPSFLLFLALLTFSAGAQAAVQSIASIRHDVQRFVLSQTAGLPGEVSVEVGHIDENLNLPACPSMEVFLSEGNRLWGNTTVGVKCEGMWSIYVPVKIRVITPVVVSTKPLAQGTVVAPSDVMKRKMDIAQSPPGVLTEESDAIGKTMGASIPSGYPLLATQLRSPIIIRQGQSVRLVSKGSGFQVTSEGIALGQAAEGQPVQVRTPSGHIVSGTARPGPIVEVIY